MELVVKLTKKDIEDAIKHWLTTAHNQKPVSVHIEATKEESTFSQRYSCTPIYVTTISATATLKDSE